MSSPASCCERGQCERYRQDYILQLTDVNRHVSDVAVVSWDPNQQVVMAMEVGEHMCIVCYVCSFVRQQGRAPPLKRAAVVLVDEDKAVPGLSGIEVDQGLVDVVEIVLLHPWLDLVFGDEIEELANVGWRADRGSTDRFAACCQLCVQAVVPSLS